MKQADFVFGLQPVLEALKSSQTVDRILLQRDIAHRPQFEEVWALAQERDVPLQKVPLERLHRSTRKNHQGIIAFLSVVDYAKLEMILPTLYEEGKIPLILVLDRITDVRNFGAICRTAEAAGVQAVVIPQRGAAQINSDAMKTSSGALTHLPVCKVNDLQTALLYLQNSGLSILAATEKASQNLYQLPLQSPLAVLVGSEEDGIAPDLLKMANLQAHLPMLGQVGSLNVSVATGVVLYEVVRQRLEISSGH
ncbi:MAG: 23S rRNA (guanosine(2251)-2'-O)-methyltransferase RlmB [Microscillaceae bacterium]|nr:23S rRNA (guanosine(2251)-2'-O)-methyltransferase RlmB [Microscillaceae bacterium]